MCMVYKLILMKFYVHIKRSYCFLTCKYILFRMLLATLAYNDALITQSHPFCFYRNFDVLPFIEILQNVSLLSLFLLQVLIYFLRVSCYTLHHQHKTQIFCNLCVNSYFVILRAMSIIHLLRVRKWNVCDYVKHQSFS